MRYLLANATEEDVHATLMELPLPILSKPAGKRHSNDFSFASERLAINQVHLLQTQKNQTITLLI